MLRQLRQRAAAAHRQGRRPHGDHRMEGRDLGQSWRTPPGGGNLPEVIGDRLAQLIGAGPRCSCGGVHFRLDLQSDVGRRPAASGPPDRCGGGVGRISDRSVCRSGLASGLRPERGRDFGPGDSLAEDRRATTSHVVAAVPTSTHRTGALRDMAADTAIVQAARRAGGLGPVPQRGGAARRGGLGRLRGRMYVQIHLNGGPGAPAYRVRPEHLADAEPSAARLARPCRAVRLRARLPARRRGAPVRRRHPADPVAEAALGASLDLWQKRSDIRSVRAKKDVALTELFIAHDRAPRPRPRHPARPVGTRQPDQLPPRARLSDHADLIDHGVHGDFRAPTSCDSGSPRLPALCVPHCASSSLFSTTYDAADTLAEIIGKGIWRDERYQRRGTVTLKLSATRPLVFKALSATGISAETAQRDALGADPAAPPRRRPCARCGFGGLRQNEQKPPLARTLGRRRRAGG